MRRRKLVLFLPAVQVLLAIALLAVGSRQKPATLQDFPPFVGWATKVCEAINAPVLPLEVGLIALSQKVGVGLRFRQTSYGNLLFLVGAFCLWVFVGAEIEGPIQKGHTAWRAIIDCVAICIGVILLFFALAARRQGEIILMVGSGVWSVLLIGIYVRRVARSLSSRN